jgi:hypothetical protein
MLPAGQGNANEGMRRILFFRSGAPRQIGNTDGNGK